ncbi:MAG: hypothetical protein RL368_1762 [Pseudomonadota bacterium]
MLAKLASHNPDIDLLIKTGYAVAIDSSGHLIIRDIPYLDAQLGLKWGAIVSTFRTIDGDIIKQNDHVIYFAGEMPYGLDGKSMSYLGGGAHDRLVLSEAAQDVVIQHFFSYKFKEAGAMKDYPDFEKKIDAYVRQICTPALVKFGVSPYTGRVIDNIIPDPIFKFPDTHTSRAKLTDFSSKFENDVIAIIGAGGTGSYIIDFLAKTRVYEIRIFDMDEYQVHNAFRSPGSSYKEEFGKAKVDVLFKRYDTFRNGVVPIRKFVDADCAADLEGVTFAFVSVDKGSSRSQIFDLLIKAKIPFIDVGMGLKKKNDCIRGTVRSTYFSVEKADEIRSMNLAEMSDAENNIYQTNIQISELNALNACLAVMQFKKIRGFYADDHNSFNVLLKVADMKPSFLPDQYVENSSSET